MKSRRCIVEALNLPKSNLRKSSNFETHFSIFFSHYEYAYMSNILNDVQTKGNDDINTHKIS